MEWAVLPFDDKSGAFSAPATPGAVVANGGGRIGGIITSGAGWTPAKDITYVASINSVMEGIKVKFPKAHLTSTRTSAPRRIHSRRNPLIYAGDAGEVVRGGFVFFLFYHCYCNLRRRKVK
jgi:hypothetical protein